MAKKVSKAVAVINTEDTEAVVTKVSKITPKVVVADFNDVAISVQQAMAKAASDVNSKLSVLNEVNQAIDAQRERLARLIDMETESVELLNFREDKERESAQWESEKQERELELKRSEDDYNYNLAELRKKELDKWNFDASVRKRDEEIRKQTLERAWQERENALKSRENEIVELQKQVASIPELLKKETAREVAIVTNTLNRDHKHALELLTQQKLSDDKSNELRLNAVTHENTKLTELVKSLNEQLVSARNDAKEIAAKAVESASGQQALASLQSAMNNQNLNPNQRK